MSGRPERVRLAVVVALAACHASSAPAPAVVPPQAAGIEASNILRADYAGSAGCADCHAAIYQSWQASPMRNMTRDAKTAVIRAPFDGASLRVGPDTATMEQVGDKRIMRLVTPAGTTRFTITKVVGGRYREDFVGLAEGAAEEVVLPATYVFSTKSWRYKGYSVMVKERPMMSAKGVWSRECIACHNTLPYVTMLYDELYGPSLPVYQGKLSDRVLPRSKVWGTRSRDDAGLVHVLEDEIRFLGDQPPDDDVLHRALPAAAIASEKHLDGPHLVELGVGCEACHNGARAHAAEPTVMPSFAVQSPVVGMTPPRGQEGTRAQWINHACAKCHTVLFTHYPFTWEGGDRMKHPGGSSISSGEGRDYQLGGCASAMPCTTCHDPHTADPADKLRELATPAGNHLCITCHKQFASDAAIAQHTHHKVTGQGSSCVACHMAKKNMGLDYALIRYHRIGSPTEPARVTGDRPLECAICHAGQSVETIVSTMEQWWGKHYDRAPLRALYGDDLAVNALRTTLARGKPHEQAVAIAVLGELRDRSAIPAIAAQLAHEYPLVRYFAQRALQLITGTAVAIDVNAPAADVERAAAAWLTTAAAHP